MFYIAPFNRRISYLLLIALISLLVIIIRLAYLQILHTDHYLSRGQKNFLRIETIQSPRGNIVDRNGILLATNRPITTLHWQGTGQRVLSENQLHLLEQLETILQRPILTDNQLLYRITNAEKYYKQTTLAEDLTFEKLSIIEELFPQNKNLRITTHFKRYYPHQSCASHVLGYLSREVDTPIYGKTGIEKLCDDILKGQEGTIIKTINSVGRNISAVQLKDSKTGETIKLTIDLPIQQICEKIFPADHAGAIVVMDPEDGALMGWVSFPTFDPSLFLSPITPELWQTMQEKRPFLNRALNSYPPGSLFKLVSISAALQTGMIQADECWYCRGYVTFADRRYWCHKRWGHGSLSTTQALAHSCNTLFFEIGKKMDIDLLTDYAKRFGLGQKTGIIFQENTGIIPSRAWKLKERGEKWWPGETLSACIGQSFLMVTPMQIARMIGAIFSGNLVKPRIITTEEIEKTPLQIQKSTMRFLHNSMRFVVTSGTGQKVNTVKDIEIYAKTSTAQMSDFEKRELGTEFMEHAWFVAYFSYKHYKPLVLVILIEHAGSSQVASGVAKQFLIEYKEAVKTNPDSYSFPTNQL